MYRVLAIWLALTAAAMALAVGQSLLFRSPPAVGVALAVALPLAAVPLAHRLARRGRRPAAARLPASS